MKKLLTIVMLFSAGTYVSGQNSLKETKRFSIGVQYTHEFVLGGYVRVREFELEGDKMKLKDLGMTDYSAIQFSLQKKLRKNRSLTLLYDQFFMRGISHFDRDITYNGTIIDGDQGIDVSPTRYYRISLIYRGPLLDRSYVDLNYIGGLVFDHIVFYLDGTVRPYSPKDEVYEGFGRQALPYPFVGLQSIFSVGEQSYLNAEISGTYIPKFKSFYTEGGHVDLQYSTMYADFSYAQLVNNFRFTAGAKFRFMHLFQESTEDTNVIRTITAGPYMGVGYRFK